MGWLTFAYVYYLKVKSKRGQMKTEPQIMTAGFVDHEFYNPASALIGEHIFTVYDTHSLK